ncbi:MAG: hypothetical protein KC550_07935, partial [Nanoarchaeota archaeon]|nr:hypothetical protein [Nanoarchaeota archaeon]
VFFKEQVFRRNIDKIKEDFNDFKFLESSDRVKRIDSKCKIEGREIWFNEYNIFEKNNQTGGNGNCFPNLSEGIKSSLLFNFQVELEDLADEGFSPLGASSYDVLVEDEDEDGVFDFTIELSYEDSNKLASFRKNTDFKFNYDARDYVKLLTVLEAVFPKLSAENKKTVPSCLNGQTNGVQNSEKVCIKKNVLDLILKEEYGKEVLTLYNLDIDLFSTDISNYFGVDIIAKNKKVKKEEFVFSVFLKYNILHNLIEFNVDHFSQADKTIEVTINEPKISKDRVYSYLVFYSYENFFEKSSYSNYDKLFELLETSQIPRTFESEGIVGRDEVSNIAAYYHSSVDSNLDLNLLAISKQEFDSKGQKKILIYQIYDFEKKEYVKLEEGKPVYIFVFAVDSAFN